MERKLQVLHVQTLSSQQISFVTQDFLSFSFPDAAFSSGGVYLACSAGAALCEEGCLCSAQAEQGCSHGEEMPRQLFWDSIWDSAADKAGGCWEAQGLQVNEEHFQDNHLLWVTLAGARGLHGAGRCAVALADPGAAPCGRDRGARR